MRGSQSVIDFFELISAVPGEGLEALVRQIGRRKGLATEWSGRGADRGADLFFTEFRSGPLSRDRIKWVVSCKDKAQGGASVSERDLPNIKDKLAQHKATGFLLVTTTTVGTAAKTALDSLDISNGGDIHTMVWDSSDLSNILLDPSNLDLLKQFLPQSYLRVRGMTSLEGAVLSFRDQLPDEVLAEVIRLIRPYSERRLKGSDIWPYDVESAQVIDKIVKYVVLKPDLNTAVLATEEIEYDAFWTLASHLIEYYPEECRAYLFAVVSQHYDLDVRFNAMQLLLDHYEIHPPDYIDLVTRLAPGDLAELLSSEVVSFVVEELTVNATLYEIYQELETLSIATEITYIQVVQLEFGSVTGERVEFRGQMRVGVDLLSDDVKMGTDILQGSFLGHISERGIWLDGASIEIGSLDNNAS